MGARALENHLKGPFRRSQRVETNADKMVTRKPGVELEKGRAEQATCLSQKRCLRQNRPRRQGRIFAFAVHQSRLELTGLFDGPRVGVHRLREQGHLLRWVRQPGDPTQQESPRVQPTTRRAKLINGHASNSSCKNAHSCEKGLSSAHAQVAKPSVGSRKSPLETRTSLKRYRAGWQQTVRITWRFANEANTRIYTSASRWKVPAQKFCQAQEKTQSSTLPAPSAASPSQTSCRREHADLPQHEH